MTYSWHLVNIGRTCIISESERSPPIEEVIQSGVVPRFVQFLTREDFPQLQVLIQSKSYILLLLDENGLLIIQLCIFFCSLKQHGHLQILLLALRKIRRLSLIMGLFRYLWNFFSLLVMMFVSRYFCSVAWLLTSMPFISDCGVRHGILMSPHF